MRRLVTDLLSAHRDNVLADIQDGGENVDIVFSRRKDAKKGEVMSLVEAEENLDTALIAVWKEISGATIEGDPVEFFNS